MPGYTGSKGYTGSFGSGGGSGGAIALIVESTDNTILQNGISSYNTLTQTITANLSVDNVQAIISAPTANDFVYVNSAGQVIDSGISLSTDGAFASPSNSQTASTQAIFTFVSTTVASGKNFRGGYDASGNVYPSTGGSGPSGAILAGDIYAITVAGTLGGTPVDPGDTILALVNSPGQTSGNWLIGVNGVNSVNGQTGNVSLGLGNLTDATITSPVNNQILKYDSGTGKWINSATASLTSLTVSGATPQISTSGVGKLSISTSANTVSVVAQTPGTNLWFKSLGANGVLTAQQINFTNLAGTIALAQVPNNLITNAKLAQMATLTFKANNTGVTADPIDITVAQAKTMLGLPSSSTANQLAMFSNTSGSITGSGISNASVATINTDATPQAGGIPVFQSTGSNVLVYSGATTSSIGNKVMVLKMTTNQTTGIANGNPVILNNIAINTTDTVSYDTLTGIISLGQNRSYRFTYIPYIRFTANSGFVELYFTVNGNSIVMTNSVGGYFRPLTSTSNETPSNIVFGQFVTGASGLNTVRVTMNAPSQVQDFYGGGTCAVNLIFVEEYPT